MPSAPMTPDSLPLRDIHLPPAISWWPPAPGWWLLLFVLILLVVTICAVQRYRKRRHFQRLSLCQLEELTRQYHEQGDDRQLLQGLSRLLRQTSILHFPLNDCAGLVGEPWLAFLDQRLDANPFSQGVGRLLAEGPYLPQSEKLEAEALLLLCRRWLQQLPPAPKTPRRQR